MFKFCDNCVITICGPRGSGKSFLVNALLESPWNDFDMVVIFCPTLALNNDYYTKPILSSDKVHMVKDFDTSDLERLFREQEEVKEQVVAEKRGNIRTRVPTECPRMLVVMDDIIDSGIVQFGGAVDKFAERGRHLDVTCIICSQRISAVSRSIRINSDYVILFSPFSISELERFVEEYVSRGSKKLAYYAVEKVYDKPREFILVDNKCRAPKMKLKHSNTQAILLGKTEQLLTGELIAEFEASQKTQKNKRGREGDTGEKPKKRARNKKEKDSAL